AFVSNRVDHSFIGIYDVRAKTVQFLAPSVDHDTSPTWSRDGRRVAFIRRPGTPFGQQAHQGSGGIGNPDGPAYNAATGQRGGRGGQGRGGQGRGGFGPAGRGGGEQGEREANDRPGLMASTFAGGYALSFWVADIATGDAHEFWHNDPNDRQFAAVNAIQW